MRKEISVISLEPGKSHTPLRLSKFALWYQHDDDHHHVLQDQSQELSYQKRR